MPEKRMMHEVGVEGDLFNVHPEDPGCQRAGCVPASTLRFKDPHLHTYGHTSSLKGWILFNGTDEAQARSRLQDLGVTVGPNPIVKDETVEFLGCTVPITSMAQLDGLWGEYYWGLRPPELLYKLEDLKTEPVLKNGLTEERVRIWSGEWGQWWSPNGCGYTPDKVEAGIYDFTDAYIRSGHAGPEKQIAYVVVVED